MNNRHSQCNFGTILISSHLVQGICRGRRGVAGTELLGSSEAFRYHSTHAREACMCSGRQESDVPLPHVNCSRDNNTRMV